MTPAVRQTKVGERRIMRVSMNDLILIILGAIPSPRSKRSIQAELWLVCGSGDWISHITQVRAYA
jgi:hypothetical protein